MTTQPIPSASILKQALRTVETLKRKNYQYQEPIAIIGLAFRFPGEVDTPDDFWKLLYEGVDPIEEFPKNRWNIDDYYDADPDVPGKIYTRYGGFLKGVDRFGSHFFGISPREAVQMDPQQRILLEVCWKALEHAGQASLDLKHSNTGVFIGLANDDYLLLGPHSHNPDNVDAYSSLGVGRNIAAGRIAYALGLEGPTLQLDTACSSSLVALHLACQSLRAGDCEMAVVGGVNLILSPTNPIVRCRLRALSPDGHCKTFDASANGYVESEGCGVIVIKPLSKAIANQDNILAIIRGSAVNHDGPSSGLTVPNEQAQEKLLQKALQNAQVEPNEISYIEAHGTGTSLGDPIEIGAITSVFGKDRSPKNPLIVGAVKSNIGHLEAAAGIAGLIKVILCMQHKIIPPNLHLETPNPHIPWDVMPLKIPTKPIPWTQKKWLAGISSFGMSGTNAHVILQESSSFFEPDKTAPKYERPFHLFTLSAKTEKSLKRSMRQYSRYLKENPELPLDDVCFTNNTGRWPFLHRLSIVAETTQELRDKLSDLHEDKDVRWAIRQMVSGANEPQLAFLFTGQGSQYPNMGRDLYSTQPIFQQTIDHCAEILAPILDVPLLKILYPDEGEPTYIHETAYTQPALFALEYALAKMWQSWGVQPSAVLGHSVGEYVAACIAGVFSLADGLKLITARGKLMQALPRNGKMVIVFGDRHWVEAAIEPYSDKISIAAINGPQNVVISGYHEIVDEVVNTLTEQEVKVKPITVSHAFHSPLMEPILDEFKEIVSQVKMTSPQIRLISNVTGGIIGHQITQPTYWCDHIRQPVHFAAGMSTLHQHGYTMFVEIGPHPVLCSLGNRCLPVGIRVWLPSLNYTRKPWPLLLQSLGALFVWGGHVDWGGFDQPYLRQRVVLPTTPYQRLPYWLPETTYKSSVNTIDESIETPLLKLLNQGDVPRLLKQMQQSFLSLLPEERKVLPKLAELLVDQHQTQLLNTQLNQHAQQQADFLAQLTNQTTSERVALLTDFIAQAIRKILGLDLSSEFDYHLDLDSTPGQLGLDSIMWLELLNQIEKQCAMSISLDSFFSQRYSIKELAVKIETLLTEPAYKQPQLTYHNNITQATSVNYISEETLALFREQGTVTPDEIVPQSYQRTFEYTDTLESYMITLPDNLRLEVLSVGSGSPLILLSPAFTAAPTWKFQVDALARQFRVIIMHYPGYARSTLNYRYASLGVIAGLLEVVLDLLQLDEPLNLIGWSTGGVIAQLFALQTNHFLQTLTLTNTTAKFRQPYTGSSAQTRNVLLTLEDDFHNNFPEKLRSQKKYYRKLLDVPDTSPTPSLNLHYSAEVLKVDLSEEIQAIQTPTLVIQGAKDKLTPPQDGRFLAEHIPQARYHEFSETGHYTPLHHHEMFNKVWLNFWTNVINS